MKKQTHTVIAIDPGLSGALVLMSVNLLVFEVMPIKNENEVNFDKVQQILSDWAHVADHIYLERAAPFKMGTTSAFNYGRGFAALEIACSLSSIPTSYIEPRKWTKVIHEGIKSDLKAKAKSLIALERLHKSLIPHVPRNRNGKLHDGVVDALLIASFGLRQMK